ncbi:MAG: hypothetical protein LBT78_04445, partial [Tannerella sp.]|nr:hypothetical protein [Tannerella sp.]
QRTLLSVSCRFPQIQARIPQIFPRFGERLATSKLKAGLRRAAWQGKSLAFSTTKSGDFAEPGMAVLRIKPLRKGHKTENEYLMLHLKVITHGFAVCRTASLGRRMIDVAGRHAVRYATKKDGVAFLRNAGLGVCMTVSTERCIPAGMRFSPATQSCSS